MNCVPTQRGRFSMDCPGSKDYMSVSFFDVIKSLIPKMGGCFASDRITVDGMKVGYMYREEPDKDLDSGWRFFSGDETQEYADNPDNFAIYEVNTICNYDPSISPYID